jgi:hypothetical protein
MLQIIGWLFCVYLVVKGFELVAMKHVSAYIGAGLSFVAAPIFFLLINQQTKAAQGPLDQLGSGFEATKSDATDAQANAEAEDASAAADRALKEAEAAIENADAALGR